jgi:hypothetical protein
MLSPGESKCQGKRRLVSPKGVCRVSLFRMPLKLHGLNLVGSGGFR